MFKTREQGGPELRIRLHECGPLFNPGDIIRGSVIRQASVTGSEDRVKISLHGRELCSMSNTYDAGSPSQHEALFTREILLIENQKHEKTLSQGSVRQTSNSQWQQTWPFAIAIPEAVDPKCGQGEDPEAIHEQISTFPPSFHAVHPHQKREALVEYFIKASLITSNEEPTENVTAILPFKLQATAPPPSAHLAASSHIIPSKFRDIVSPSLPFSITSQRLAHGAQDVSLSLLQKAQKYWLPSSVPKFGIRLWAGSRVPIDPSSSEPISFYIAIMPDWMNSSKSIGRVQRKAVLTNFSIKLEAIVGILCQTNGGTWPPHYSSWTIRGSTLTFTPHKPPSTTNCVEIPCTDEAEPVNIGKAIDLRLNQQDDCDLPVFQGFYMYLTYHSHWTLEMEIHGEKVTAQGSQAHMVLPNKTCNVTATSPLK